VLPIRTEVHETPNGVIPPTSPGGRSGFLSDVIVELGFAESDAVERAVLAARRGTTVARALVESGEVTEEQLARATAERYGLDYVDLDAFDIEPAAANLIPPGIARRDLAVPVGFVDGVLLVAMLDPTDSHAVAAITAATGRPARPAVAARPGLEALLAALPLPERPASSRPAAAAAPEQSAAHSAAPPASPPAQAPPATHEAAPPAGAPSPEPAAEPPPTSRLREELGALRLLLERAEAKLEQRPAPEAQSEVEELRMRLAATQEELGEARARLREAKEVAAELAGMRERLLAAEAELARPRDSDWLRQRLAILQAERDEALRRAHKAEWELQELRAQGDSELPNPH